MTETGQTAIDVTTHGNTFCGAPIMRRAKTMLALLIFCCVSSTAFAGSTLVDVEKSYELNAAFALVPSSPSGFLLFRACADCRVVSLAVNNNTQYALGRETVSLEEFREDAVMRGLLYVYYDANSEIVTRVRLRGSGQRGEDD